MPKIETFLTPEQIKYIEENKGKKSRSEWIKVAVQEKIDVKMEKVNGMFIDFELEMLNHCVVLRKWDLEKRLDYLNSLPGNINNRKCIEIESAELPKLIALLDKIAKLINKRDLSTSEKQ